MAARYVTVTAIVSNPNTDPHSSKPVPKVARTVGRAQLVVQNGLGYDAFMNDIESASPNPKRKTIDVQELLKLPDSTPNPHLWYKPCTMPKVARAVARDLSALDPGAAPYFAARLPAFDRSLKPWTSAMAYVKRRFPGRPSGHDRTSRELHVAVGWSFYQNAEDASGRRDERR